MNLWLRYSNGIFDFLRHHSTSLPLRNHAQVAEGKFRLRKFTDPNVINGNRWKKKKKKKKNNNKKQKQQQQTNKQTKKLKKQPPH